MNSVLTENKFYKETITPKRPAANSTINLTNNNGFSKGKLRNRVRAAGMDQV